MDDIYVLDASGYLYRSYFAIQGMTNAKGESTNALFGFIRSILRIFKDFEPTHLVAVFDGPNNSKKRTDIYPEYKANRSAMPPDLRYQMDWAREFCSLIGIPYLSIPEVEADDTMGTIAKWAEKEGANVFLCTSDKDMCQLVDDKIHILNTHKDNLILDPKEVENKFGVPPQQIIDLLAITGDSSDNVPGLPGFGPKTAVKLLQEFETLDNILANPDSVPGKKKQETIREEKNKALVSRELVTIDTSVEIPHESSFFALTDPNTNALKQFYTEKNFNSLLKELNGQATPKKESTKYHLIDDEKSFAELLSLLKTQSVICFDTETTSVQPLSAELVGIGFGFQPEEAWYVPVNGNLGLDRVLTGIKPLFENPQYAFYGHNVKYDIHILANYEVEVANIGFDTILASYILNSHSRRHSLDQLSYSYFDKIKTPTSDLLGKGKKAITMREVPIQQVSNYCCEDVDYTVRLKALLEKELEERNLTTLYHDIELSLLPVLTKMERHGIFLDAPVLEKLGESVHKDIAKVSSAIFEAAGEEFNLNSPKQLSEVLYTKLKIKPPPRAGTSTSADVLEVLEEEYPIATDILEYRSLEKLRSTYIEALPQEINPKTHRIHPTFNQSVAATGRLSCQDPNLQNIPVRSELGRHIREAFRPEKENWSYLSADYSQIELRLLAHFSEDPTLVTAFENNEDIHTHTAATLMGIPLNEVTKEQRYHAKAVNFGILYGQQAYGLSREIGISMKEAANFIELYFDRYKRVKDYLESCKDQARLTGKATTITGRERKLPEILSKNAPVRQAAERLAVNTPLQGSAADLIKLAMIEINKKLTNQDSYLILQIHDELIFESPDQELPTLEPLVRDSMEQCLKLRVPLIVDVSIGKNWMEC